MIYKALETFPRDTSGLNNLIMSENDAWLTLFNSAQVPLSSNTMEIYADIFNLKRKLKPVMGLFVRELNWMDFVCCLRHLLPETELQMGGRGPIVSLLRKSLC